MPDGLQASSHIEALLRRAPEDRLSVFWGTFLKFYTICHLHLPQLDTQETDHVPNQMSRTANANNVGIRCKVRTQET